MLPEILNYFLSKCFIQQNVFVSGRVVLCVWFEEKLTFFRFTFKILTYFGIARWLAASFSVLLISSLSFILHIPLLEATFWSVKPFFLFTAVGIQWTSLIISKLCTFSGSKNEVCTLHNK